MQRTIRSQVDVGVVISGILLACGALACAPEAPLPDEEIVTAQELVTTPKIRTRDDLLRVMNEVERHMGQLDRLEGRMVGDFAALGALAAELDSGATALRLAASTPAAGALGRDQALLEAVQQMERLQMSFNLQYLALQQKMQDESRRFTLLSNIMKTKHDTAKNSISNIR